MSLPTTVEELAAMTDGQILARYRTVYPYMSLVQAKSCIAAS